jgi:hypothetical protein
MDISVLRPLFPNRASFHRLAAGSEIDAVVEETAIRLESVAQVITRFINLESVTL